MAGLVLYSRPGCHLCEDMHAELQPLLQAAGLAVEVVNIDTDAGLRETFGIRIPVLVLDGEVISEGRLDADAVADALKVP
ncbi:MAG TPA: glutaredoxin family protein [Gammaproteobacteria bacterium]